MRERATARSPTARRSACGQMIDGELVAAGLGDSRGRDAGSTDARLRRGPSASSSAGDRGVGLGRR